MLTIKLLKGAILVFCLVGVTVLASSCASNKPISSNNEKGFGGEGR